MSPILPADAHRGAAPQNKRSDDDAVVVSYARFLERRAWRAKIAADLERLNNEAMVRVLIEDRPTSCDR